MVAPAGPGHRPACPAPAAPAGGPRTLSPADGAAARHQPGHLWPPSQPMIYTFYSYKGGVGRTMALANVAEVFYRAGLRVLMVDWDLESPGLERYFPEQQEM